MITIEMLRMTNLEARLDSMSPALQTKLRPFMAGFGERLREKVKANIATEFLSEGPLYQSVKETFEEVPGQIDVTVTVGGGQVKYARIQEEGGVTSPHEIRPRVASVLAFEGPGGLMFAKRVNHPGSRIPARPYARTALAELRGEFEGGIRAVVADAIAGRSN